MSAYNDLSNNQKYAISKIMDGTISLIEELCYTESRAETIATAVLVFMKEEDWLSIDEVIEVLNKYKEGQL